MNGYAAHAAEARLLSADLTAPEDLRAARRERRSAEAGEEALALARALTRMAGIWPGAAAFIRRASGKDGA